MNKEQKKQLKTLFKKHKGLIKKYNSTVEFNEPVLLLIRRTNKVEFYEDIKQNEFNYEHSDGTQRILLLTNNQLQFDYGDKKFRGYIAHEDFPTPLPEIPEVSSKEMTIALTKVLHDISKWKTQEWKAKSDFAWKIGAAIALIIVAITLYAMLKPQTIPKPEVITIPIMLLKNKHLLNNKFVNYN